MNKSYSFFKLYPILLTGMGPKVSAQAVLLSVRNPKVNMAELTVQRGMQMSRTDNYT